MRKLVVLLLLSATAAVAVALAQASTPDSNTTSARALDQPSPDRSGPYDFAVGGAERSADIFAARHVAFSAHNGPRGTTGEFTSHAGGPLLTFTGEVTCLRVDGNRAVIGGIIRQSAFEANEGTMFFAAVEDNGNPSDPVPDRVSAYFLGVPPGEETCDSATVLYASLAPIESGNINVNS